MRHVVCINQTWLNKRDGEIVTIKQVHRADRSVRAVIESGESMEINFSTLRDYWRKVT
jgi:hypothetical protein